MSLQQRDALATLLHELSICCVPTPMGRKFCDKEDHATDADRLIAAGVVLMDDVVLARALVRQEHPSLPFDRMWEHGPTKRGALYRAAEIHSLIVLGDECLWCGREDGTHTDMCQRATRSLVALDVLAEEFEKEAR